jgi:hypothetical protein
VTPAFWQEARIFPDQPADRPKRKTAKSLRLIFVPFVSGPFLKKVLTPFSA